MKLDPFFTRNWRRRGRISMDKPDEGEDYLAQIELDKKATVTRDDYTDYLTLENARLKRELAEAHDTLKSLQWSINTEGGEDKQDEFWEWLKEKGLWQD